MKALIFLLLPMLLFAQNGDFPATQPQNPNQTISQTQDQLSGNDSYRWSFGIFYIPYYSGEVYSGEIYEYGNGLYSLFSVSKSMTLMEGQFSYSLSQRFRATLNVGYSTGYDEIVTKYHNRYDDPLNNYDFGAKISNNDKFLNVGIGVKFYLKRVKQQTVSPYVLAGIGKQFAFSSYKNEDLFVEPIEPEGYSYSDNFEEFIEDLNSPVLANLGFGAEYLFNPSLSVFSAIRFNYMKRSGIFEFRDTSPGSTRTGTREFKVSETTTHIGLGMNFYF
ncbi:MAG: hypothetical protein KDE52_00495 [Calditrichaeota bacterium]|nr:hypothetical protein [Calditrichota bacterium]